MIQDIIELIGTPEYLPWLPELLAYIILLILVLTGINFLMYVLGNIFKL